METIHATTHYTVLQPADGSFRIVGRSRKAREVLREIATELKIETGGENAPVDENGSCTIRRNNPFGLVRIMDRCDARMALAEIEQLLGASS